MQQDPIDPVVEPDDDAQFLIDEEDIPGVRSALTRYRVMAWVVGILLVILVCIGMPLKYIWNDGRVVTWTGIPHGWLYAVLLITAYDLGRRAKCSATKLRNGTVPAAMMARNHLIDHFTLRPRS